MNTGSTALAIEITSLRKQLKEAERQRDELLADLEFARDEVANWGMYASEYFRKKHDLGGSIDRIDAAIAAARKGKSDVRL